MTRPAERVLHRASATGPTTAKNRKRGWWSRHRRAVVPRILITVVLAAAVLGVGHIGLDMVLRVAGAIALLVIALGAAAVGALALTVRRRLAELQHLPDLGRPFVTNHEDGLVTGLSRDGGGNLVLEVTSEVQQTIVLDEQGAPEHMSAGGAAILQLPIPGSAAVAPDVLDRIEALFAQKVPVRLVSEGVVTLTGPVPNKWRLEAEDGLVVSSRT